MWFLLLSKFPGVGWYVCCRCAPTVTVLYCVAQQVSGCIGGFVLGCLFWGVYFGVFGNRSCRYAPTVLLDFVAQQGGFGVCLLIEGCRYAPTVATSLLRSSAAPGFLGYVC